ncbi:MAG: secondary thiamine-phosphate synthase enzyme YjbQ [Gammaproteobacteria bacterium]
MYWQEKLTIKSTGRGTFEITSDIEKMIQDAGIQIGLCHLFIQHTSASLIISENADPSVRDDLETFMSNLCPDGDSMFTHISEGHDDMPAHIRSVLTQTELSIPINSGRSGLGVWQGIYLWEHRAVAHQRQIIVTMQGE